VLSPARTPSISDLGAVAEGAQSQEGQKKQYASTGACT